MIQDIEQRLKQDGKAVDKIASSRLEQLDLRQAIEDRLMQAKQRNRFKMFGVAAALALIFTSWLIFENKSQYNEPHEPIQLAVNTVKIKALPAAIEAKVNEPFLKEQQAIIEDLKALRKSMFSI